MDFGYCVAKIGGFISPPKPLTQTVSLLSCKTWLSRKEDMSKIKCSYCGVYTKKSSCPKCGAPIDIEMGEKNSLSASKGGRKPAHCRKCNSVLKVIVKNSGYNSEGERNYHIFYKCPNYSFPFGLGHDSLVESLNFWEATPSNISESDLARYDYSRT